MTSLLNVGINSLRANQYAMTITGQNIANANTASYSRRDVIFSEPFYSIYGNGVTVADPRRLADESLSRNVQISNSALSKSNTFVQNMQNLELIFDSDGSSISGYINESLKALNVANTEPSSTKSRDMYLYELKNIVARFNVADANLDQQQITINNSLKSEVNAINQITSQLVLLNNSIPLAPVEEKNSLFDQRDDLLTSLSKYMNYDMSLDENGTVSIQLSNGTPLVLNNNAYTMVASPSIDDPSILELSVLNNHSSIKITNMMTGGEIGGLLAYQNSALGDAKQSLGRLALVLAQSFNNQNKLGIDLDGNLGRNIFTDINKAEATRGRVINYTSNQGLGDLAVSIRDARQLTTSDYQLEFTSSTAYQLIRTSDHQVMSSGNIASFPASIQADGFSIDIASGSFVAGDKFTISPTRDAASDFGLAIQSSASIALGMPVVTGASQNNSGMGKINVTAITDPANPAFSIPGQLNPPILIEFLSTTSYRLVNALDNSVIEAGLTYDPLNGSEVFPTPGGFEPGFRIQLTGNISAGDSFTVNYNVNGSGDNRNGLLIADLYQQGVLNHNSLNFSQAFHLMTNDVASKINSAQITLNTNLIIQNQAEARRDQLSGVSLQEETINLARFQQAYEASAQIIEVGRSLFDIVIGLGRR